MPPFEEHADAGDDVVRFALREEDDAAVHHDVGVGAVHHEEVREVRDGDPQIGAGVPVPTAMEVASPAAHHLHRCEEARCGEARAVDDDVDRDLASVDGPQALLGDPLDTGGDKLDVLAPEGRGPQAVVADEALRERRVVGQHLLEEHVVVAALLLDVEGEHLAHHVVGGAHGPLGVGPIVVDLDHRQQTLGPRPEQPEAVPLAIEGKVPVEPVQPLRHCVVVVGCRQEPGRGSLEDEEL